MIFETLQVVVTIYITIGAMVTVPMIVGDHETSWIVVR
jgi:hypothetical protein